ncbi:MAG TPA: DUF3352 domain-containing protein [Nocardioidaceae bacterium]|nr:DUF3352 domain-containing protein [Nocardioidaceae bacterium]
MSSFEPEYLTQGEPAPAARRPLPRKVVALVASAAAVVAVVGAGVWGFNLLAGGGGPRPDSAMPADTLGYLAIDLDPATGQKLEALRTLRRIPSAAKDIGDRDDLREWVYRGFLRECEGITYADDIEPWLGERAAMAFIEAGDSFESFYVLQVTDRAASERAYAALGKCTDDTPGTAYVGEYAVIASSQRIADDIAADAEREPLSEDANYQAWMSRAGDPGIVTAYLAKRGPLVWSLEMAGYGGGEVRALPGDSAPDDGNGSLDPYVEVLEARYADFEGFAGVVRFEGGGLEASLASKGLRHGASLFFYLPPVPLGLTHGEGNTVGQLPADTGAAIGFAFEPGWLASYLDTIDEMFGVEEGDISIAEDMTRDLGITVEEAQTLLGSAVSVAVDPSAGPDTVNLDGPQLAGTPIGARLSGDPAELERILAKLLDRLGRDGAAVEFASNDGQAAVGFDRAYAEKLLKVGTLGETDRFRSAVPDAEKASGVIYADLNAGSIGDLIAAMFDFDSADVEAVSTFGMSDRTDDDGFVLNRIRISFD